MRRRRSMQTHCLRLTPGQDLKQALQTFAQAQALEAGIVLTGLGSFAQACLRFAAAEQPTTLDGPLELISLSGTLSCHGLHLHGAVADAQGRVYGGHIMPGCVIRTTAEIAVASLPHLRLDRQSDAQTGYLELVVASLTESAEIDAKQAKPQRQYPQPCLTRSPAKTKGSKLAQHEVTHPFAEAAAIDLGIPLVLLPSAFCLLPSAFCLLPSAFCLLPSAFCLLPSAFCLLPSAFCPALLGRHHAVL